MTPVRGKVSSTGVDDFVSYPSAGDPSDDEKVFPFLAETNIPENEEILQQPRVGTSAKQPLVDKPTQGKGSERTYKESPLQAKPEKGHSKKAENHETDKRSSHHQPRPTKPPSRYNISHNIASQSASYFEEASTVQGASGQHRSFRDSSYPSQLDVELSLRLKDRFGPRDQMQRAASIPMAESTDHRTPGVNQFNNSADQVYDGYVTYHAQPRYSEFPHGNSGVNSYAGPNYANAYSQAPFQYHNAYQAGQQMPTRSIPFAHDTATVDLKKFPTETYGYYQNMLEYQKNYLSATDQGTKAEHRRKWDVDYLKLKGRNGIFLDEVPPGHPLRRTILLMDPDINTKMKFWEDISSAPKP